MADFHNPYTFVPTPDRSQVPAEAFAGDHDPREPGHQENHLQLWPERYTGIIALRLKVITPLFITKTPGEMEDANGHKTYDPQDNIPVTAIKGVLRSASETITNSRFGIFGAEHRKRLGRRMGTEEALRLVPGMIVNTSNGLGVQLLPGTTPLMQQGQPGRFLYAAWLRRYNTNSNAGDRGESGAALSYSTGAFPAHRDLVRIRIVTRHKPHYVFHEVVDIWDRTDRAAPAVDDATIFDGIVCRTGPTIKRKHHERVFFCESTSNNLRNLSEPVIADFRRLIRDYRSLHEEQIAERESNSQRPDEYLGHEPGKTAWGPYLFDPTWEELDPATPTRGGSLVYVRLDGAAVRALFPAMISRDLHPLSPWECLPQSMHPAEDYAELSPADRLFGWVKQGGAGAWRGRVRISTPDLVGPQNTDPIDHFVSPLPLAILGRPRPEQARFYLGNARGGKQSDGLLREAVRYAGSKKLRGRKAYYHHKRVAQGGNYWRQPWNDRTGQEDSGYRQEYRQPEGDDTRTGQNRSITGWIKPGSRAHFKLFLENLTSEEVGAMIALAALPDGCYFRLGLGKPLGLGSIRLELDGEEAIKVASGKMWRDFYYADLDTDWLTDPEFWRLDEITQEQHVNSYKNALCAAYPNPADAALPWERLPFIAAFLRTAAGPTDNLPVHYPRTGSVRAGSHVFDWFTANEHLTHGSLPGLSLPDPTEDDGLPYDHNENQE